MQIDEKLILRLEHLARLELSEEERVQITGDLNNILEMVEKLQELNPDSVEPLIYINEEANVFRADEVKNQVDREAALNNAPDRNKAFFKVPKVIDLDR